MSDRSKDETFGVGGATSIIPDTSGNFQRVQPRTSDTRSGHPKDTGEETAGSESHPAAPSEATRVNTPVAMSDRSKDEKFGVGKTTAVIPKDMPRFPRVALETPAAPSALPNDTGEETAGSPEAKADRTEKTDQGASRSPKHRRKSAASASQPAARSETTRIVIAIGMSDRLVRYRAHLNARFHLTGRTLNAAVSKPIQDRFREVCAKKRYKAFKFAPPIDGTEKIYLTVALPTEVFDDIRARFDPDRILSNAALMRMMFANVIREMEADGTIP